MPSVVLLVPNGGQDACGFSRLEDAIYAPLTAGLLRPFPADHKLQQQRLSQLDRPSNNFRKTKQMR